MNWDERYSEPGYTYGTEPNDFLVAMADRIPLGSLLSLGEGEGRNGVYLASRGYSVTGVDGSPVGLRKAAQLAAERGVTLSLIEADLSTFQIEPNAWEGIVACYCHLPAAIRAPLHRAAVRGLKQGGVFLLEGFSKEQLTRDTGGPKSLDMLFDLDELRQELAGLDNRHGVTLEREVREGSHHTGLASVVQILGVRL